MTLNQDLLSALFPSVLREKVAASLNPGGYDGAGTRTGRLNSGIGHGWRRLFVSVGTPNPFVPPGVPVAVRRAPTWTAGQEAPVMFEVFARWEWDEVYTAIAAAEREGTSRGTLHLSRSGFPVMPVRDPMDRLYRLLRRVGAPYVLTIVRQGGPEAIAAMVRAVP